MKIRYLQQSLLAFLLAFGLTGLALAKDGTESGGGGNLLVSSFVDFANTLLKKAELDEAHYKILKAALDESKIVSVKNLIDPATSLPVPDQANILAYSSKGLIQLKEQSVGLNSDSWQKAVIEKRLVGHIVIHELFRATGLIDKTGRSIDDNFQLSLTKYRLHKYTWDGMYLDEPPHTPYWSCQCFDSIEEGAPGGGFSLPSGNGQSLIAAESIAQKECKLILATSSAVARCHKYIGKP
jgi:hypothetical protein